jgi:hypothetical protein
MTEEIIENEAPIEVQEEQQEVVAEQPNTELEEKARRMGWRPQDEYKGDPARWTDAESFVRVGEERIPVMKENFNKLEDKYKTLEQKVKAQEDYQKHMGKIQYERAMKDLKAEQIMAVEEADTEKFQQLEQKAEQIKNDYSPKQPVQDQAPQEVAEWQAKNAWFNTDYRMTEAARFYENQLLHMPLAQRLEEVSRKVNADFAPPKEVARKLPAVEGARQHGNGKAPAKTWSDIDPNHLEAANTMVKSGLLTKADYLKDYFGE